MNPMPPTACETACEQTLELLTTRHELHIQPVADIEQLRQLWEIDKEAYQDCSLSFERFLQWWEAYEFGSRVLLDGDRILASIGIYPIAAEQALAFMDGQALERELIPVSLEQCEAEPQHYWYASGIVTAEQVRGWGSPLKKLLQMGLSYWLSSGHIAYPLHLFSIAEYEIGARLLNYMGFQKTRNGSTLPDGCDLHEVTFDSESQIRDMLRDKGL